MSVYDESRLLTNMEAAAYLGLKPETLTAWRSIGRYDIPFVKVGRSVRYRMIDLQMWIEKRLVGSNAVPPQGPSA